MFSISTFFAPTALIIRGLNALLRKEDWARGTLARHSGKTVCWEVGTFKLSLTLDDTGYVQRAEPDSVADVTVTLLLEKFSLARFLSGRIQPGPTPSTPSTPSSKRGLPRPTDTLADKVHIAGDAGLAHSIAELAAYLRWDVEDTLADWIGDIPAARLVRYAKQGSTQVREGGERLTRNVAEYLSQERSFLVGQPTLKDWRIDVTQVHTAVERLQDRMAHLQARLAQWPSYSGQSD